MRHRIRDAGLMVLAMIVISALVAVSSASAAATTGTISEQTDYVNFIALGCANGGENILFEGSLHTVNHLTVDSTGGRHLISMFNFQSVLGVGQTSGLQYEFASAGTFHSTFTDPGNTQNTEIRARIIAPGSLDNLFQDFRLQVTIAPDGRLVVFRIEDASGCVG
jgi:hypothetical protein